MRAMCHLGYHHNDFVATHTLGHRICELLHSHCGDNWKRT